MFDAVSRAWSRWRTKARVQRHGWTAIYVGDYDGELSWVYTIGFRRTLGAPEVIAFDLPTDVANALLWQVFRELESGELSLRDGERWGDPSEPQACWRRVHPSRLEDDEEPWLGLSRTFDLVNGLAGDFEAFQLVLSDHEGRLPWEPGYDERLRAKQRELYLPRLAEAAAV
jgi:hypothetical protein